VDDHVISFADVHGISIIEDLVVGDFVRYGLSITHPDPRERIALDDWIGPRFSRRRYLVITMWIIDAGAGSIEAQSVVAALYHIANQEAPTRKRGKSVRTDVFQSDDVISGRPKKNDRLVENRPS
jgi:hypothetical protein